MKCPSLNKLLYLVDIMDYMDHQVPGISDAIEELRTHNSGEDTMHTWQKRRKPHQGPCNCDDCGKHMQWKEIDWCITNNGYLLCTSCMLTWVRENRYHKDKREETTSLRRLAAAA